MYGKKRGVQKGLGKIFSDIILLIVAEGPIHGYEISKKLEEFRIQLPGGVGQMGRIYRILTEYEEAEFVTFEWDTSYSPPRKIYRITNDGKEYLKKAVEWADNHIGILNLFIERTNQLLN